MQSIPQHLLTMQNRIFLKVRKWQRKPSVPHFVSIKQKKQKQIKSHLRESRKWQLGKDAFMWLSCHITVKDELDCIGSLFFF